MPLNPAISVSAELEGLAKRLAHDNDEDGRRRALLMPQQFQAMGKRLKQFVEALVQERLSRDRRLAWLLLHQL